jgi:DNA-binding LacI/PurR family transcriptional regulator
MRITIRDIARQAGVSVSTVSRAMNHKDDVSEEVRQRVLATAQELNYFSNPHARALIAGRSRTLGLIIAGSSMPFLNVVVTGVLDAVSLHGYSIMVYNTGEDPQQELQAHRILRQEQVAGVLATSVQSGSAPFRTLREENTPFVLINRRLDDMDTDYTMGDLRWGLHELVGHLSRLGHRRIAFLADRPGRFPVTERLIGYQQALADFGIPFDSALVRYFASRQDNFYDLTRDLMASVRPAPTAIFPYNDWAAAATIRALVDLGYRVPEDVSVVGYDDLEVARYLMPALTTMTQQAYEIGKAGVDILVERLSWPVDRLWAPHRIVFKPELVVRSSTAPAKVFAGS